MNPNYTGNSPMVSIQKSAYADIDIKSLLNPLGGIHKYIKNGERVLLKTNLLTPSIPEKAVVTHPAVISAVAQAILEIGGIPYIGDSPSGQFTKRRLEKTYEKAGLKDLANNLGIELNYDTSSQKIIIPYGKNLKKTVLCNFILNADKIIALPKIKTHSFMIMTLATKIMYGVIPGLTKAKYHSMFIKKTAFADMLLDVLSIKKPVIEQFLEEHREIRLLKVRLEDKGLDYLKENKEKILTLFDKLEAVITKKLRGQV